MCVWICFHGVSEVRGWCWDFLQLLFFLIIWSRGSQSYPELADMASLTRQLAGWNYGRAPTQRLRRFLESKLQFSRCVATALALELAGDLRADVCAYVKWADWGVCIILYSILTTLLCVCAYVLQAANKNVAKVPPPVPTKPKQINLPYFGQTSQSASDMKPDGNPQQLPMAAQSMGAKLKPAGPQPRVLLSPGAPLGGQDQVLSPGAKQESPPAAAVRPFTPQPSKDTFPPAFRKPPTVAASSIYSMYTQHQAPGKNFQQAVQSALTKTHPRGPHFSSGKVLFVCIFLWGRGRVCAPQTHVPVGM